MRGWVLGAMLLGLFGAVPWQALAGQLEAVRLQGLALRQGPDGTSPMIRALRVGETVTVTARKGEYVAVTLADGQAGYVHGGFLTGFDDIAPMPAYAARMDRSVARPGAGPGSDMGTAETGKTAGDGKTVAATGQTPPAKTLPDKTQSGQTQSGKTPAAAGKAAPAPAAPAGANRETVGKLTPPPAMPAYVPVADGGGLDRFLATLVAAQPSAAGAGQDAAEANAHKIRYAIEVHLSQRKLYLYENLPDGSRNLVRLYVVAVPGRDMEAPQGWGTVTGINFEPSWRPTPAMKERALKKGKPLPEYVGPGVKDNPMGTFKIILSHGYGFRIHGNNNPGSIGRPVTSGCIRMRNDEGKDLAKMIDVGTEVVFLN